MLREESVIIKKYLKKAKHKIILNVCSSDENFFKVLQPYIWKNIHKPVLDNKNQLLNLDMKDGIGIDIIEVSRFKKDLSTGEGKRFIERVFTPSEITYCKTKKNRHEND